MSFAAAAGSVSKLPPDLFYNWASVPASKGEALIKSFMQRANESFTTRISGLSLLKEKCKGPKLNCKLEPKLKFILRGNFFLNHSHSAAATDVSYIW